MKFPKNPTGIERSMFLPGEGWNDVMDALNQAEDYKQELWRRMKANGVTHDSEIRFRQHCQVVNFVTPEDPRPPRPMARDPGPRHDTGAVPEQPEEPLRAGDAVPSDMEER